MDRVHVLLIMRTGGETGLFYSYILLFNALNKLRSQKPHLKRGIPKNPVLIIIYPTNGLKEEMVGH